MARVYRGLSWLAVAVGVVGWARAFAPRLAVALAFLGGSPLPAWAGPAAPLPAPLPAARAAWAEPTLTLPRGSIVAVRLTVQEPLPEEAPDEQPGSAGPIQLAIPEGLVVDCRAAARFGPAESAPTTLTARFVAVRSGEWRVGGTLVRPDGSRALLPELRVVVEEPAAPNAPSITSVEGPRSAVVGQPVRLRVGLLDPRSPAHWQVVPPDPRRFDEVRAKGLLTAREDTDAGSRSVVIGWYTPREVGDLPVQVAAAFGDLPYSGARCDAEGVRVVPAAPLTLHVAPLPPAPPGFAGTVGSGWGLAASSRGVGPLGEPIGVSLRLTGAGSLGALAFGEPTASNGAVVRPVPTGAVREHVDAGEPSPRAIPSASCPRDADGHALCARLNRRWEVVVAQRGEVVVTFPEVVVYDVDAGAYRTLTADPVVLRVE